MPECRNEGHYKAPKDRGLKAYYFFCMDHVQEYNRAWDFFEGMPASDIESHITEALYGDRPTWRSDAYRGAQERLRDKVWQEYHFADETPPPQPRLRGPEAEALYLMGLRAPVTLEDIKTRYKSLAKKYHPDLVGPDPESEELLKKINMAYTILKLAYKKFETLPPG